MAYFQLTGIKIIACCELEMIEQEVAMLFFKILRASQQTESEPWLETSRTAAWSDLSGIFAGA